MFDTETEVIGWIKKQREEQPWISETGLVCKAFALGYDLHKPRASEYSIGYDAGYADGLAEGYQAAQDDYGIAE